MTEPTKDWEDNIRKLAVLMNQFRTYDQKLAELERVKGMILDAKMKTEAQITNLGFYLADRDKNWQPKPS